MGHDPQSLAGGLHLEEYLEWLGPDFDLLWLDVKNLNQENVDEVFARLYWLDKKYRLRSRTLVEGSFGSALGIFAKNGWSTALFMTTDDLSRLAAGRDAANIGGYFAGILQQLKTHGLEGVSYDLMLDHLVRGFLLPFLPQSCKCSAWRHAWKYTDADLLSKIKHYPHLSRLLIALDTLFDL
mgnify:CR=1 FL=1